ncbi:MAG: hypothetical protein J0H74_36325 [Chitinophagaceae bacterium]|nr:hypothetical protein [Chitinophagaceae bacterium]
MPIRAIDIDGAEPDNPANYAHNEWSRRDYEASLYKKDPEHAGEIIYEHNKHAFIFVGGMITAGSGSLASLFFDGVSLYGMGKFTSGIIKKDDKQVKDGMETMNIVVTGEITGILLSKVFNGIVAKTPKVPFKNETAPSSVAEDISTNTSDISSKTISGKPTPGPSLKTSGGKTIRLGLEEDLYNHRGTGAITWQNAGLTKVDWGKTIDGQL